MRHIGQERRLAAAGVVMLVSAAAWSQWVPSFPPNPSQSGHNFLMGVSASSGSDAWAVGYSLHATQFGGQDSLSLAVHWDGSGWTQVPTPSPGVDNLGTSVTLLDVEIVAPDDVWAAGAKTMQHPGDGVIGGQLFVIHWDGSEWTEVAAPITPVGGTGAWVRDIHAFAPDDIWFVGMFNFVNQGGSTGLAMHWDGSSFTLHQTPNFTQNSEKNQMIDRDAQGNLWVVGMHGRGGFGSHPYVLRGDGVSWDVIGSWNESQYGSLETIVAISEDDVWIGMSKVENFNFVGYVWMHWDGSSWTEYPVPEVFHAPRLAGVSATEIYSGGESSLYRYDGVSWTHVGSMADTRFPHVNRIDLAPDGAVIGAGRYFPIESEPDARTLGAQYLPDAGCAADLTGDGSADSNDFFAYLDLFAAQDGDADITGNGVIDGDDFFAYLDLFAQGC